MSPSTSLDVVGLVCLGTIYLLLVPTAIFLDINYYYVQARKRNNTFIKKRRPEFAVICLVSALIALSTLHRLHIPIFIDPF